MPLLYRSLLLVACVLYLVQQASCFAPSRANSATKSLIADKNKPMIFNSCTPPATTAQTQLMMSSEEKENNDDAYTCSVVVTTTAILGILSSLTLLWSEASIVLTRCGPSLLPDFIERSAYISTFIVASGTNLSKTMFGSSMTKLLLRSKDDSDYNSNTDGIQVSSTEKNLFATMEYLSFISVASAFGVLAWQVLNGDAFSDGAGMSGIDIRWCQLMNE